MAPGDPKFVPCRIRWESRWASRLGAFVAGAKEQWSVQDKRNRFQVFFLRTSRIAYCVKQYFRVGNQFVRRM